MVYLRDMLGRSAFVLSEACYVSCVLTVNVCLTGHALSIQRDSKGPGGEAWSIVFFLALSAPNSEIWEHINVNWRQQEPDFKAVMASD